jgi:hypothetical protein
VGVAVGVGEAGVGTGDGVGVRVGDGVAELLHAAMTAGKNVRPAAPTTPRLMTSRRVI